MQAEEREHWKVSWNPFGVPDTHLCKYNKTRKHFYFLSYVLSFVDFVLLLRVCFFFLLFFSLNFFFSIFLCFSLYATRQPLLLVLQIISLFAYVQIYLLSPINSLQNTARVRQREKQREKEIGKKNESEYQRKKKMDEKLGTRCGTFFVMVGFSSLMLRLHFIHIIITVCACILWEYNSCSDIRFVFGLLSFTMRSICPHFPILFSVRLVFFFVQLSNVYTYTHT